MATTSRSADLTSGPMLQKIILFSLPLAGPYTVTVEPLRGGARQTLTQDDLPGDCLPLTGPNAKYTVAADLQGEDGAVYHAQYVFIFRKEAS